MRPLVKLLEEDKKTINARRNEGSLQPNCRAACGAKRLSTSDYQRCRTNYCFTFRYCSWKCKHKFSQPTLAVDAWTWQRSFNSTILKWDGKDKDKKCKHKKTLLRFTKNQLRKKHLCNCSWQRKFHTSGTHGHQSTCAISTTALPPHISNLTIWSSGNARAQCRTSNRNHAFSAEMCSHENAGKLEPCCGKTANP